MKLYITDNEGDVVGEIHDNFEFDADIPIQQQERIRTLIRSSKKFNVDIGPVERPDEDMVSITPGEAFTEFHGEEALMRVKMAIDWLTPYSTEIVEEEEVEIKAVESPEDVSDDIEVKEGPPGFHYYTVSKGDDEVGDGEMLEIRDYYRVWVRDRESVPDEQMALYDDEGDEAGNHWYYEVPFETSTRIDLSDEPVNPDEVIAKDDREIVPRELSEFGVPTKDSKVLKAATNVIEDGDELFSGDAYEILKKVESPITLLSLYKLCHDTDGYDGALTPIQNELARRGVETVDRLTRKRRVFGDGSDGNVNLEKTGDVFHFDRD
jgi:hypothetical protein